MAPNCSTSRTADPVKFRARNAGGEAPRRFVLVAAATFVVGRMPR